MQYKMTLHVHTMQHAVTSLNFAHIHGFELHSKVIHTHIVAYAGDC